MSVSGNEEIGVKPFVLRQSSCDYPAGIPIKKRRYPMIWPSSPPPEEEPSSSPVDSSSLQKDQSSPVDTSSLQKDQSRSSQGSTLSHSSVVTSSCSVLSDSINKSTEPEGRALGVKIEEPNVLLRMGSLDNTSNKEKAEVATNPLNQIVLKKSELSLVAIESLALKGVIPPVHAKQSVEVKVEAKTSELKEKTGPLLIATEKFHPVLLSQNSGRSEPISLKLSLSKENIFSSKNKTDVFDALNVGSSRLFADRANWDLNTPMDKWVGPSSDIALGQTSSGQNDMKPLVAAVSVAPVKPVITDRKNQTNLSVLSNLSGRQSGDSLHLRPSPSVQFNSSKQSTPTLRSSSDKAKLPRVVEPSIASNKVSIGAVKAEPVEESIKADARGAQISPVVKRELVYQSSPEGLIPLHCLTQKSVVDPRPVKPEPASESTKQTIDSEQRKSLHLNERVVQGSDKQSSAKALQTVSTEYEHSSHAVLVLKTSEMSSSSGSSLSIENELRSGTATCKTTVTACPIVNSPVIELARNSGLVASDTGAALTTVDGESDIAKAEDSTTNSPEIRKSKSPNNLSVPSRGNVVGSASDEEKINTSAEIEVSYGSEYESDGNRDMDMSVDMEIDSVGDYEDGEVRESLERIAAAESVCEKGPSEPHGNDNDLNTEAKDTVEVIKDSDLSSSYIEVREVKTYTAETGKDSDGTFEVFHGDKCDEGSDRISYFQELNVENPLGDGALVSETDKAVLRGPLGLSSNRGAEEYRERDSKQVGHGSVESLPTFSYGMGLTVNGDPLVQKNDVALAKSITDVDNAGKDDMDDGSHHSRIINLPRSSGSSSPGRNTRTFSGRLLQGRAGRERLSDLASFEGGKIHSRGREDMYFDSNQKFSRERHYNDQTHRNSRFNFVRGRGRFSNRPDNFRGGDREFTSDYYNNGPIAEFRVPRHKFGSSVSDPDLEYNSYSGVGDVAFVSSGRGGVRKPMNDGGHYVRRMPARRRSPPGAMVRRISRNLSPNIDDGSELVRSRCNAMDPTMFAYEGVDRHFAHHHGNRSFQRRVVHRMRSKSPVGSRTWSSPRRRSPDGFSDQRSPPFYRMERLKSPIDRRCFPGEVVARRQDNNNRSPSGRIVIRERRFGGGVDPQERPEGGDGFYAGPPGSGDANGNERRFGERRPYRTNFNGGDAESFHVGGGSEDGGSRPLRFDGTEFQERDFNRRMKNNNNNNNAPRRMRNSIEDQEVNYRHGNGNNNNNSSSSNNNGQVWHNNEFDDMSRIKRKRY